MLPLFVASARTPAKHNLWVFCPEIPDFGQETRLNDVPIDALVKKRLHTTSLGRENCSFTVAAFLNQIQE
jgi:hypothetical protein